MNRMTFLRSGFLACALFWGVNMMLDCHESQAQGVAPPVKKAPTAQVLMLQSEIELGMSEMQQLSKAKDEFRHKALALAQDLEELRGQAFALGVSPESYAEVMRTLQTQRIQLTIDIAGLDSRRDALYVMTEQAKETKGESSLMDSLQQMAQLQQENLKVIKALATQGSASSGQLRKAEMAVLETKIRISQAQVPDGNLGRLNSALLDVSLDRAEKRARLEQTSVLLGKMADANKLLAKNRSVQRDLENVNALVGEGEMKIRDVASKVRENQLRLEQLERKLD